MHAPSRGLYKDSYERDSCGFGLIASLEIVNDLRTFLPKFWVVKPKAASIDSLIDNLRRAA